MANRSRDDTFNMTRVHDRGFTLVELMVALLVISVLLLVGVPGFSDMIRNNRLLSEVYSLRATLNKARAEALAKRTFVTVCASEDGSSCLAADEPWNPGYIAFTDDNADGVMADPNDIVAVKDEPAAALTLDFDGDIVRFDSRGYATLFNGRFTACDGRGLIGVRGLDVSASGIVSSVDPNDVVTAPDPNDPCGG